MENMELRETLHSFIRQYKMVTEKEDEVYLQKQKVYDEYVSPLLATAMAVCLAVHVMAHLSSSLFSTLLTTRYSLFDNQLAYF